MRALTGMLLGFIAISVLHRFQLLSQYVHLRVTDDEDVAFHLAGAAGVTLEFKLNSIFCVHEACAADMQRLICHGAQIDQKPELVIGVELRQIHVWCFIFVLTKKRLASSQMSLPSMQLLYSMLGEPFTVTLTFVRSGLKYFSETLVPGAYSSIKRRRMPFRDLLWGLTLMVFLVLMPFEKVTVSAQWNKCCACQPPESCF